MYEQIRGDILFTILYAGVLFMALIASCYLLLRRGNAFAPDIIPPVRLRRWTGVYFAFIALNHVWYLPILYLTSNDDILMIDLIGGMLDSMTVFPLSIVVLLSMLQDRRRPLWPIAVMTAPVTLGMAAFIATRNKALYPWIYAYLLLMGLILIIYMVHATRQYGRWLRDNYADLEHKEVWQSFIVLAIVLLVFVIYEFTSDGPVYIYAMLAVNAVLIVYLLWRVETLTDLSIAVKEAGEETSEDHAPAPNPQLSIRNSIGSLLEQYCEQPQLYLQHDLTLSQLAQAIGTNRLYLSQYFSSRDMTYNAYINGLRIQHFTNLYREALATHQAISIRQLSCQSGFHSYSTFNAVFKQSMGMTATEWMRTSES